MNKTLFSLIAFGCISLHGMEITVPDKSEKTPQHIYPAYIGHMTAEQVLAEPIPAEVQEDVKTLLTKYKATFNVDLTKYYELSSDVVTIYSLEACAQKDEAIAEEKVLTPSSKHLIWIPQRLDQVITNLSSMGYDPFVSPERNNPETIKKALNYQPTVHNLTRVVAQRLLEYFGSKTVKAMKSWVYPLHVTSKPFDDRFYIPVHEIPSKEYKFLHQLTEKQKDQFFEKFDLIEFHEAIRYISFPFPNENNLVVNPEDGTIIILNSVSANNEGYGPQSKYGKAIMEETEKSLSKAYHNLDNPWDGQRHTFEGVLTTYCPSKVKEWNDFYKPKEKSSIK